MKLLGSVALLVLALVASVLVAGQLGLLQGQAPTDIGVKAGRLKPPSEAPNSVSSQAAMYPEHPQRSYANIAPLTFGGDGQSAMDQLAVILSRMDGCIVITQQADYLYAQCTTPLFRLVDDAEFWFDRNTNRIQVRSASRLGYSDFGGNRARIEKIRAQLPGS